MYLFVALMVLAQGGKLLVNYLKEHTDNELKISKLHSKNITYLPVLFS